jgi:CheY-like chemotaxis protein
MRILFLDDDPERHALFNQALDMSMQEQVWAVYDVAGAIDALEEGSPFDIAFLDHDLDGRIYVQESEGTGTEVAQHITTLEPADRPGLIVVHSFNPAGASRMLKILQAQNCNAQYYPFGSQPFLACLDQCNAASTE